MIEEIKGPALNSASPQSELAPAILEKIKIVLQDGDYVERLKRHYRLFKEKIEKPKGKNKGGSSAQLLSSSKISGNDPCPCGSGKKYKKCCSS